MSNYYFPFGQPLTKVQQTDTTRDNKVFVLGVYASAVHARWSNKQGKQIVAELAVASEPYIFWRGDDAEQILSSIKIPKELGSLVLPPNKSMNGPSSIALDNLFLNPLDYNRKQSWLCDLLPESRVNPDQRKALNLFYTADIVSQFNLPLANIPDFDEGEIKRNSNVRHLEILNELESSGANTLILLGDIHVRWFFNFFDKRFSKLSDFGNTKEAYGRRHEIKINNKSYSVIPLCHPRNAARLGPFSKVWAEFHDYWTKEGLSALNNH